MCMIVAFYIVWVSHKSFLDILTIPVSIQPYNSSPFPKTLQPLAHWWTPDVPPEYIGIDHLKCWVFLPSMVKDYEDLPVVPVKVRDPHEELPYSKKLTPPVQWVGVLYVTCYYTTVKNVLYQLYA